MNTATLAKIEAYADAAFPAEGSVGPEEAARTRARFVEWARERAPDAGAVGLDLVAMAVRGFHRADRVHKAEEAEACLRVRHSDATWRRREAGKLVETVAKLETNPLVAAYELESTVMGCAWALENLRGVLEALRANEWRTEHHILVRKLLKHDARDPDGSTRAPDVWFNKVIKYCKVLKNTQTLIQHLPWEIRVITYEKLELGRQRDEELLARLREKAQPMADKIEALVESEIARYESLKADLEPLEALDREQAKVRALVDDSPLAKQRARILKESEATIHAALARLDVMYKKEKQASGCKTVST